MQCFISMGTASRTVSQRTRRLDEDIAQEGQRTNLKAFNFLECLLALIWYVRLLDSRK